MSENERMEYDDCPECGTPVRDVTFEYETAKRTVWLYLGKPALNMGGADQLVGIIPKPCGCRLDLAKWALVIEMDRPGRWVPRDEVYSQ